LGIDLLQPGNTRRRDELWETSMASLTILHISDLHRDLGHELTNRALLDSLEADRERYQEEEPVIPAPELIVVSGDIIHGVKPTVVKAEEELKRQYDQAAEFLVNLTDSIVGGDRERVVIIPGNHDVSYFHVLKSMTEVPINLISQKGRAEAVGNVKRLWTPNSMFRWSWGEMRLYKITDLDTYAKRLEAFCRFYEKFYQGKRRYSLDPAEQFDVFDFAAQNVTIVGMSSCYGNDPINKLGAIHPDCLAGAARRMRDARFGGRLLLAVWHHNTSGGPTQTDYVDTDILQCLIDDGFSIGFHGHQHRPQFIDERHQFGTDRKITVISAGSLCAGPVELPSGQSRGYNLVQIDVATLKGTLHQRRMHNDNFGRPIWGPGTFTSSHRSFVDFLVQKPRERNTSAADASTVGAAESLIRGGKNEEAAEMLRPLHARNLLARRLLLDCYTNSNDTKAIIDVFYPPQSIAEIVQVADALWEEKDKTKLKELLDSEAVRNETDRAVIEVRNKYLRRLN
jgi:hypothetical protein